MNNLAVLPTYIQEKVSQAIVPVQYVAAVKALAECRNIDEAKYYADKADALAAWAKIYKSDRVAVEAKRLKLHAFRRMGIIAQELRPSVRGGHGGSAPGTLSLLRGIGLSTHDASAVTSVTRLTHKKFRKAVESDTPRAPSFYTSTFLGNDGKNKQSESWKKLHSHGGNSAGIMQRFCRKHDPKELARGHTLSEAKKSRKLAIEIIEWMDTFEQYLPK